jgi:hypothetical protein
VQELLHHLNTHTFDPPGEQDSIALGVDIFCKALIANFFLTERRYSAGIKADHVMNFGEKETVTEFVTRFFEHLKFEEVSVYDQQEKYPYTRYQELSILAPQLIHLFGELIRQQFIIVKEKTGRAFVEYEFSLKAGSDRAFDDFFGLYLKVKGLTPFLRFGWRGLSTGEQSFLSFMSRFVHLKRHQIGSDQLKNNLVIMIDEGDAGFHPEWQKQFFKLSLDFLSSLFKDHHIQLIFTANAPFLTSDLPKSHVLFLEKVSRTESTIHEKDNDRMQTFGSNIHQLFMDSFYMEGVIMGDFAKGKIDNIIKFLNNKRVKNPDEKIRRTIDQIGEPLIRRKLQAMWQEKFGIQSELAMLEQRIADLKAEQKRKNKLRKKK